MTRSTKPLRQTALVSAAIALFAALLFAQTYKPAGTQSGFVATPDGVKIHYLEAGRGKAILFIPGWTMPAWIWEPQITYFSKGYHVVAMDPRSQGESSKPSEGDYPAARARDIKAVVDQLRLAPVVLVGWSMGVSEIAAYVDQFGTASIAGLVLVDGVAGGFDPKMTSGSISWVGPMQRDRSKFTADFLRSMFKKPQSDEYLNRLTQAALETPTDTAVALFIGMFTADNRPALAKVDKPTLIVIAAGESSMQPMYDDMQKRISNSRLEILDGVGHALFVDDAAHFNRVLSEFLSGLK